MTHSTLSAGHSHPAPQTEPDPFDLVGWTVLFETLDPQHVHPLRRPFVWRADWINPVLIQTLWSHGYAYFGTYRAPKSHCAGAGTPIHIIARKHSFVRVYTEARTSAVLRLIRRPVA